MMMRIDMEALRVSRLSKNSIDIQKEFVYIITHVPNTSTQYISKVALTSWITTKIAPKEKLFHLIYTTLIDLVYKETDFHISIQLIVAIDWVKDFFKKDIIELAQNLSILHKNKESYPVYLKKIEKIATIIMQPKLDVSNDMYLMIYSSCKEYLGSVYLPTKDFEVLKKDQNSSSIQYILWDIFDDPYPRSKTAWKERIDMAEQLFGENEESEFGGMDIPNSQYMIRRNKSPDTESALPFTHQLLSEEAMMDMVTKWSPIEKFFIKVGNVLRSSTPNYHLQHDKFGPFLHGMMQYFALKSQLTPFVDERYKLLYRGLYATSIDTISMIDKMFPMDLEGGRKTIFQDKGIIATSFDRNVSEKEYTKDPLLYNTDQLPYQRGVLMVINIDALYVPLALIEHSKEQNEVLLMPGTFKFVELIESKRDYDVIAVKYTPDFGLMKKYPGVYNEYVKRISEFPITKKSSHRSIKSKNIENTTRTTY